jgi:hypothetical protein
VKASLQTLSILAVLTPAAVCLAQIGAETLQPSEAARTRPNSVLLFGGRLSTTDLTSTLLFNLNYSPHPGSQGAKPAFDNDIVGVEYERDVLQLAHDLRLRAEGGIDDRFGHYLVCCLTLNPRDPLRADRTSRTRGLTQSVEVWAGGKVRWENFKLGGINLEVAGTVGLSGVSRTLGRERQRAIDDHGNAHVLGFVAPELGASLERVPRFELVVRVMHRSGAGGTFGGIREGYNADVVGLRYTF